MRVKKNKEIHSNMSNERRISNWKKRTPLKIGIGQQVRKLRKQFKLTLKDLSLKIDCHPKTLSNVEMGIARPSIAYLQKLSKFFKVPIDFIASGGQVSGVENDRVNIMMAGLKRLDGKDVDTVWNIYELIIKKYEKPISRRTILGTAKERYGDGQKYGKQRKEKKKIKIQDDIIDDPLTKIMNSL